MRESDLKKLLLDERMRFPAVSAATREGLVAIGGDFSVERLLLAYRSGIFPWTANPITWWSPDPRAIIELDRFHVSRSLAKFMRKRPYEITVDQAFKRVMEGCAAASPGRGESWVKPEFIDAYARLFWLGHAHSVECWRGSELVGGIYGVSVGGFFAGESMFHRADNASKIALASLVERLRHRGYALLDVQMVTPTTLQFGAVEISRADYLRRLEAALELNCRFSE